MAVAVASGLFGLFVCINVIAAFICFLELASHPFSGPSRERICNQFLGTERVYSRLAAIYLYPGTQVGCFLTNQVTDRPAGEREE
jgi:hypothetical protein